MIITTTRGGSCATFFNKGQPSSLSRRTGLGVQFLVHELLHRLHIQGLLSRLPQTGDTFCRRSRARRPGNSMIMVKLSWCTYGVTQYSTKTNTGKPPTPKKRKRPQTFSLNKLAHKIHNSENSQNAFRDRKVGGTNRMQDETKKKNKDAKHTLLQK